MPVTLSELFSDIRELTVSVGASELRLRYRISGITPEIEERFNQELAQSRNGRALVSFLSSVLVAWDLTDETGQALEPTPDVLVKLPVRFLAELAMAINQDIAPNPTSAGPSGAGSPRRAS